MEKIEFVVVNTGLLEQLDMCAVSWRPLDLQKCIWDYLSGFVNLRERSKSFMKKSWANKAWILEETDHEDIDIILSSQYNTTTMLWRLLML